MLFRSALKAQDQFERLEVRRSLEKYGLYDAKREFAVTLSCPVVGLSGRIDLLVSNDKQAAIVDFKLTASEPGANLHLQLAAYGLMVEEARGLPVNTVFIYRIPDDRLFPIDLTIDLRKSVLDTIASIRALDNAAMFPEPTPVRGRCEECEFANFCADIW